MIYKLTALLEYLDLLENFHVRNCCMILAYEIYFTTKIKQITVTFSLQTKATSSKHHIIT